MVKYLKIILPSSPIITVIACVVYINLVVDDEPLTEKKIIDIVYSMSNEIRQIKVVETSYDQNFMYYSRYVTTPEYDTPLDLLLIWLDRHST